MLLPIDQGIEHGPRDFFPNPASKDPDYQFRLAAEAGYSALACQIGLAEKYYPDYAGQVPLILKVNGKTDVPPSDEAFSTMQRLGRGRRAPRRRRGRLHALRRLPAPGRGPAPAQGRAPGLRPLRDAAGGLGLPARRGDRQAKGGRDSFYAIDYAARMAMEMGADVVKLNMPKLDPEKDKDSPAPYNEMAASARRRRSSTASTPPAARWSCSRAAPRPTTRPCSATPARSWRPAAPA